MNLQPAKVEEIRAPFQHFGKIRFFQILRQIPWGIGIGDILGNNLLPLGQIVHFCVHSLKKTYIFGCHVPTPYVFLYWT